MLQVCERFHRNSAHGVVIRDFSAFGNHFELYSVFQCYVIIVVEKITSVEQMKRVRPKRAERSVSFLSYPQWLLYVAYACKLVQRLFAYSQNVLIFVFSLLLLDKSKGR